VQFLERQRLGTHDGRNAMIMRITWGKLRPGSWSDFERTYNATVAARGTRINGLRGRWLLQDTDDKDTGFAVSLWETGADMQSYEQSDLYRQDFAPALQPFFVGEYKTYRCEVKYMQ
jgi:heme-degrading monooxygenase HmoA